MFPSWLWDDFCPQDEKLALEEASGERLKLRDVTLPMGVKNMKTGSDEWQIAWAKIYSVLSEDEIAALEAALAAQEALEAEIEGEPLSKKELKKLEKLQKKEAKKEAKKKAKEI
jgi:hypothetical protein